MEAGRAEAKYSRQAFRISFPSDKNFVRKDSNIRNIRTTASRIAGGMGCFVGRK